jgi:hypothetical protein
MGQSPSDPEHRFAFAAVGLVVAWLAWAPAGMVAAVAVMLTTFVARNRFAAPGHNRPGAVRDAVTGELPVEDEYLSWVAPP